MDGLLELAIIMAALVALDLWAWRFGFDSRPGFYPHWPGHSPMF